MKATESHTQSFTQSFLESMLLEDQKERARSVQPKSMATKPVVEKQTAQHKVQRVHCPTCGSAAERYSLSAESIVRTQCSHCDYLMVMCSKTGRVIEAYAPSFSPSLLAAS